MVKGKGVILAACLLFPAAISFKSVGEYQSFYSKMNSSEDYIIKTSEIFPESRINLKSLDDQIDFSSSTDLENFVSNSVNTNRNDEEQGLLINWGYALTDAAMRKHVLLDDVGKGQWPIPEYSLD